jgi:hypothetical protein
MIVEVTNAKNLATPLGRASGAAGKRGVPLERCVLLQAEADVLTLTTLSAHSHELCLRVPDAHVVVDGQVLLPAETLHGVFAGAAQEPATLSLQEADQQLLVNFEGDSHLNVFNEPPAAFPKTLVLPPVAGVVDGAQLAGALACAQTLLEGGEFVALAARDDQLHVYSRSNRKQLYSRSVIDLHESVADWACEFTVDVLSHLMHPLTGPVTLRLDPDDPAPLVFQSGHEYLLIRQVAGNVTAVAAIDAALDAATPNYGVVKAAKLANDVSRVCRLFKPDSQTGRGYQLSRQGAYLQARCESSVVGKREYQTELLQAEGELASVLVDPELLGRALDALDTVDLTLEYLTQTVADGLGGEVSYVHLRLSNWDQPELRRIMVPTIL